MHNDKKENSKSIQQIFKLKCDTCKFDKDNVKLHIVQEHRFMLCLKCDENIEHKEIMLTKNFVMKDFLSVGFRDVSLKEIAKMVNY